jgi:hypothetical protein
MLNYNNGIHPQSGETYTVDNDIIVTPFWTEDFCAELVALAKEYDHKFSAHSQKNVDSSHLGYDALYFAHISQYMFEDYARHYVRDLIPIINKVWPYTRIGGWQSPFILKYEVNGKRNLRAHHDLSEISFNIKLNNDYEGAELRFPRQGVDNKDIPVGHMMMWPSTVTHYHEVPDIISGVKYSVTGWTWPSGADQWHGIKNV